MTIKLPHPSDHVQRQGDAVRDIAAGMSPRLLYVSSFAVGLVTLKEADGSIIDTAIPFIGVFPPQADDAVIRLTIPGRGDKAAASSFVAIGPINRVSGASGIVTEVGAQGAADVPTTTSTSVYSDAIVVPLNLGPGLWTIKAFGSVLMRHSAGNAVDVRTEIGGVGQSAITQSVVSSGYDRIAVAGSRSAIAGPVTLGVRITFKANEAGTATADQPALMAIATRIG